MDQWEQRQAAEVTGIASVHGWLYLKPGGQASPPTQHFRCCMVLVISRNIYFADKFLALAAKTEDLTTLKILGLKSLVWSFMDVDKKSCKKHFTGSSEPRGDKL